VRVEDVTSRYACFALWGPQARDILQPLTESDVSDEAFPYLRARELNVGPVPCRALRVTFVGELGFELYCPAEFALALWDRLLEAGRPHGLVPGGYRAIESMRLEKGYRVWGTDVTSTDTPFEAGLGFAVRMDKGDFLGRKALEEAGEPERRLVCLVIDDPRAVVLGSEPVRIDGRAVGRVTSGGYGYTVARSIAYAYLPAAVGTVGRRVDIGIFGRTVGAEVVAEPLFDPKNTRVRA
jgi:glycine cleavage system aminomethyltransferase T